jgi:hypothetical protein
VCSGELGMLASVVVDSLSSLPNVLNKFVLGLMPCSRQIPSKA